MDGVRGRLGHAACGVVMTLAWCTASCAAPPSPEGAASPSVATSGAPADAGAMEAAEATVRAFFAVKGRAENPFRVQIDERAAYLTARDVHPGAAYEAGSGDRPSGITDSQVSVELSRSRWVGDDIQVDFRFVSSGVSYPVVGEEVQLDEGAAQESHWEGTATLEDRDGEWLISDLTTGSFGGEIG